MLLSRSVLGVLQFILLTSGTFGQNIRNRNVHCDEFYDVGQRYFENNYGGYYHSYVNNVCEIRNYEISSDREYYLDESSNIFKLIISDSLMEKLPQRLLNHLYNLEYLIIKNTTLEHVDQLSNLYRLTSLDLSSNQIVSLDAYAFTNCQKLSMVNLNNNKITILPGYLFGNNQNYQYIDLSYNEINNIMPKAFAAAQISKLNLSYNSLEELDLSIFNNIINFDFLDLSNNKLKTLNSTEPFQSKNMVINLSSNELTSVDLQNSEIKSLNLRNNKIKYLVIGVIEEIDAEDNEIAEILVGPISSLQTLNMNKNNLGNNLEHICKCTNLTSLSLNSNNIDNIGYNLAEMKYLKTLRLARNKIYQLNHESFHAENNIELLDLSFNRLEEIDEYTMAVFDKLKYLYLNGNPIHDFNDSPKQFMPNLLEVGLSHNKFKCSKLFILMKKLKNQDIKLFVDKTLPLNTTNIDGNACYQNHEGELLKGTNSLDEVLTQKTNEKLSFFWQKISDIDAKVNALTTLNKTMQELIKSNNDQVKSRDLIVSSLDSLSQRVGHLEEMFRNKTEEKVDEP